MFSSNISNLEIKEKIIIRKSIKFVRKENNKKKKKEGEKKTFVNTRELEEACVPSSPP